VAAVAKTMAAREELLADVRYRLEQAQAVQKKFYDRLHRPVSYAVGDWVLLRLRQRAASSLPQAPKGKLKPRFVGPYQVTECINQVAVRLALPPRAKLHDVFHVGLLKKFVGAPPATPPPLPPIHHGAVTPEPEQAVRYRLAKGVRQVLIRWKGQSTAGATWEDVADFRDKFPQFQLEDELTVEGGEMSCTGAPIGAVVTLGGLRSARPRQVPPSVAKFRKIGPSFLLHALIIGEFGWAIGHICRVTDLERIKQDQLS